MSSTYLPPPPLLFNIDDLVPKSLENKKSNKGGGKGNMGIVSLRTAPQVLPHTHNQPTTQPHTQPPSHTYLLREYLLHPLSIIYIPSFSYLCTLSPSLLSSMHRPYCYLSLFPPSLLSYGR